MTHKESRWTFDQQKVVQSRAINVEQPLGLARSSFDGGHSGRREVEVEQATAARLGEQIGQALDADPSLQIEFLGNQALEGSHHWLTTDRCLGTSFQMKTEAS